MTNTNESDEHPAGSKINTVSALLALAPQIKRIIFWDGHDADEPPA
jgi:hypothetical protein